MDVFVELLLSHWGVLGCIIIAIGVSVWHINRKLNEHEEVCDKRTGKIHERINNVADDVAEVQKMLERLDERSEGQGDALSRIEDFIMNRGKK